jgi:hypothetical protein
MSTNLGPTLGSSIFWALAIAALIVSIFAFTHFRTDWDSVPIQADFRL